MQIRAGMANDLTNEIVGRFKGPGTTGAHHVIRFTKKVQAQFITFQIMEDKSVLQINGINLNERPIIGKILFHFLLLSSPIIILFI